MRKVLLGVVLGMLTIMGLLNGAAVYTTIRTQQCYANGITQENIWEVMSCTEEAKAPLTLVAQTILAPSQMISKLLTEKQANQQK